MALDLAGSTTLQRYFEFHWSLIGNLGVDLLVVPLAPIFGLELAVKFITIGIAVATTASALWVSREVHGRVTPTAFFAIPFVYSFPFNYGFINFSLSIALALAGFALWLRLTSKPAQRAAIFVPIAILVWVSHAFGWGVLGLLIWSSELVVERDEGHGWMKSAFAAGVRSLPLCVPLLLMFFWRSGDVGGVTSAFFEVGLKTLAVASALRDRWLIWDALGVGVAVVLLASAVFDKHVCFSRRLGIPAIVLTIAFLILPRILFGSNYTDMRLPPLIFMLALVALRPRGEMQPQSLHRIALLAVLFVSMRFVGNAVSFEIADVDARQQLKALNHIPHGAPVLTLVGDSCGEGWPMPRHVHLGSYVIVRNEGFSNDQFDLPGAQLLNVNYARAGSFTSDPSEFTVSLRCRTKALARAKNDSADAREYVEATHRTADQALRDFPRAAFDYVWLIHPEGFTGKIPPGLRLVWSGSNSWLFKVAR